MPSVVTKAMFALPLCSLLFLTGCNKDQTAMPKSTTTDKAPVATSSPATTTSHTTTATANENPEQASKTRVKMMKEWGNANKTMGSMIKDPSTFNADAFRAEAKKLEGDAWSHFGQGTKYDRAKAEIWTDTAGFQAEVDKYKNAVTALNTVASTATSADAVKGAFGEVGASCKSCHDKFRGPE